MLSHKLKGVRVCHLPGGCRVLQNVQALKIYSALLAPVPLATIPISDDESKYQNAL